MRFPQVVLVCIALGSAGCALPQAIATRISDMSQNMAAKAEDCRQEQQARQDALAAEREEWMACREAEREARRAERETQTRRSLQAKVSLDLSQHLQMGQIEVDQGSLEKLMAQRKLENDEQDRIFDEVEKRRRALHAERARRDAATQLQAMNSQFDCAIPAPCSCGIPPYLPAQRPAKRAIRPTEIPFVIPVTMEIGMESGGITSTRMRRLPAEQLPAKRPCPPSCAPACGPGHANFLGSQDGSGGGRNGYAELFGPSRIGSEPTPAPGAVESSAENVEETGTSRN